MKLKLIIFDMEGTLFKKVIQTEEGDIAPSAWSLIAKHLEPKAQAEEEETKRKWNAKKYAGYVEWMEDTIRVYQKYTLKKEFFEKVMASIEYHDGVHEVFKTLKKKGYKTALISGGFKAQADRAQKDLKIDHAFTACELFWDDKGNLLHWNLLPCDYQGKVDFMKLIMQEHGLKKEDCAFVGDGKNDVLLAKAVGLSIAFNGPLELQKVCTHAINQEEGKEDFSALLKFF
jgi:phosphoserine phosphatase